MKKQKISLFCEKEIVKHGRNGLQTSLSVRIIKGIVETTLLVGTYCVDGMKCNSQVRTLQYSIQKTISVCMYIKIRRDTSYST